jgi:hypothetical protein
MCGRYGRAHPQVASDFGPWLRGLLSWFDQGRAVGFDEINPLMRELAGVMFREEKATDGERLRSAVVDGLWQMMKRR